ncbi:MAG: DUF5320 domain-containing protein [Archaeoglobi archaeon]|nr:DUF5320 domain-containing protein [Candidatus Mnemosynella sp.]
MKEVGMMYPGRGPFRYLPPWLRPGWWFRPRFCWWLMLSFPFFDSKTELEWLRAEREYLREWLRAVEERIKELEEGE